MDDVNNLLEGVFGNGLCLDIWMEFKECFGIKCILEFYGVSEGNVVFVNFFNKDKIVGFMLMNVKFVKYDVDVDEIVCGIDGLCVEVV